MMIRLAYGGSPFPSPEGSLFSLAEILAPARGILSGCDGGMIMCSSLDGLLTRLMMCQSAYGCSCCPPPEGSLSTLPEIISPARESPLAESDEGFSPLAEIDRFQIDDVSIGIRLFAFPSARRSDHFIRPRIHLPPGESALAESDECFSVPSEMMFL